jgi:ABC-type multidrug transport system fused ATPase/permease subunit
MADSLSLPASKRIPRTPDKPWAFVRYVLKHCSASMKRYALMAYVLEIIATTSDVMLTWSLGRIVGVIVSAPADPWPRELRELAILAGLWTSRNAAYRLREYMERRYVPELLNVTRALLFARLIQQSQAFLHANFAGVLANHVRRAGDVIAGLREKLQGNIIPLLCRFLTAGTLLWGVNPQFALFIPAFIVVGIVCAVVTAPRWTALSADQAEKSSQLTGYIVDSTSNLSIVQQKVCWSE